jgi:CBS domain-containing protein
MTVALILASKGHDVVMIQPHRTLREAAALLADKGIGAAIVSGGVDGAGEVLGMISERDIVRAIGRHGAGVLMEAVSKHMTSKVVTTVPGEPVDHIMELMTNGRFRHVPVVENSRLVGVISVGDVVKFRLDSMESDQRAMRDYIATA